MAKILFSALIADARGKFGGGVFSKNSAGNYLREFVMPSNPNTTAQQAARSRFGAQSQRWRSLTEAQRDLWRSYARDVVETDVFGERLSLNGFQLFMRLNTNLAEFNMILLDEPAGFPDYTGGNTFNVDGGILNITTPIQGPESPEYILSLLGPVSVGRETFSDSEFRTLSIIGPYAAANQASLSEFEVPATRASSNVKYVIGLQLISSLTGWKSQMFTSNYFPVIDAEAG